MNNPILSFDKPLSVIARLNKMPRTTIQILWINHNLAKGIVLHSRGNTEINREVSDA